MNKSIKIAIADDELLFLQGLKAILENESDFEVVITANNGKDLIEKLKSLYTKPDVVITDLKMPELNGVETTKIIRKEFPDIKIIALTSYFSKPFILNMISLGAVAYLAKNSTPTLMVTTIREVYHKGFFYDEQVLNYVHESISNPKASLIKSNFDADYFTKRELEVLELICKQDTSKDIAEKLFISKRTVESHRNSLLLKSESKNIAGLVIFALKNKLVNINTNTPL